MTEETRKLSAEAVEELEFLASLGREVRLHMPSGRILVLTEVTIAADGTAEPVEREERLQ